MTQTATQQAVTQPEMTLASSDLSLTPAAREKMAELFSQVDDADLQAIRVFVSGGGLPTAYNRRRLKPVHHA